MKKTVSRFVLQLIAIELIACLPFVAKVFEGRAHVLWSHYGLRGLFWGALIFALIGLVLAATRLKNRRVGIVVAAVCALPMFLLPIFEMGVIVSMPGF